MLVQKVGDGLQQWIQTDALLEQLQVGETDLGLRSSRRFSVLLFFRRLVSFSLQSFDIAWGGLEEQFLQGPPVVQTTAHLGDQFFRNVHGKTASFQAPIEDVAGVLLAGLTSAAVFANARAAAQAKRAENRGPETAISLCSQRRTSEGDSDLVGGMCYVCHITHILVKRKMKKITKPS